MHCKLIKSEKGRYAKIIFTALLCVFFTLMLYKQGLANTLPLLKLLNNTNIIDTTKNDTTFVEAIYPGGEKAWTTYIMRASLRVPEDYTDNVKREITVTFTIDETGKVTNVIASPGPRALQKVAIKAIKESDRWTPAKRNGRPVSTERQQQFSFDFTNKNA